MTPELINGLFALGGVTIGIIATSVGTYMTLRHQTRMWKNEKLLQELQFQRDEIDKIIEGLGNFEPWTTDDEFIQSLSNSPLSRTAMYKLIVFEGKDGWSKPTLTPEEFGAFLAELSQRRNDINIQITDSLKS